jgi:hypothetical protein
MNTPTPITHEELSANKLLAELPPDKAEILRKYSLWKGQSLVTTLKEALLRTADEINTQPMHAGVH